MTFQNMKSSLNTSVAFENKVGSMKPVKSLHKQSSFHVASIQEEEDDDEDLILSKNKASVGSNLFDQPARHAANTMNALEYSNINIEGKPQLETVQDG